MLRATLDLADVRRSSFRLRAALVSALLVPLVPACGTQTRCGAGTHDEGGICVLDSDASVADGAVPPTDDVHVLDGIGDEGTDGTYAALDRVVGDARFVGLAAGVYTSGGYQRVQHRAFRYLVEHRGFRALAVHTPRHWLERAAQEGCDADPLSPLRRDPWGIWASDEFAALLRFVCAWNEAHPDDRVVTFGFDPQAPWDDGPALREFLARAAGDDAATLTSGFSTCVGVTQSQSELYADLPIEMSRDTHAACLAGLDAIASWLDAHAGAASERERGEARIQLRAIRSAELLHWHYADPSVVTGNEPDDAAGSNAFAVGLHEVLRGVSDLEASGKRVVVLAINTHLMKDFAAVAGEGTTSLGGELARSLGDDYVAIAMTASEQGANWPSAGLEGYVPAEGENAIEPRLRAMGSLLLVDLHDAAAGSRFLSPGELVTIRGVGPTDLAAQFDAVVYLERAEPMRGLLW